jgi:anti-sigma factor RsiW
MMHPPDSLLLAIVHGGVDADDAAEVRAHIEDCAVCRQRLRAFREVDEWLGAWTELPAERDLTAAVLERLRATTRQRQSALQVWYRATRYAAAILVGVGAGYAGSAALRTPPVPPPPALPVTIDIDAEIPGGGLFTSPSATGLWLTLDELGGDEKAAEDGA